MTLLKNATLVYGNKLTKANILIEDRKIKMLSIKEQNADKVIDIKNKLVLPGLIDAHVHFREPGLTHKEDFLTGSMSAVAGGITTILDMPNTLPPTTTISDLQEKRELAKKSIVNYGFHFGAVENNLKEILRVKSIASIKAYMGESTGNLIINKSIESLFKTTNNIITLHAEDGQCLEENKDKYPHKAEFHHKIRDKKCAIKSVGYALEMAKKYNTNLHFAHITSKEEIELISDAKKSKVNVTCEVTPHHLFLNAKEEKRQGNFAKVNPPLREISDVNALWSALQNNKIDIIATDHAPHTIQEKEQDYDNAPSGVPGLETMLPLLFSAFNKNKISLGQIIRLTSNNPANIFKIKDRGEIKPGNYADLVVVDTKLTKVVNNDELFTKCKWSPFNRWRLKGWPVMTIVNGNLVYEGGSIIDIKGEEVRYL
ncbi:MAG: dihydroorotase family protein [Nanoarchaeota archaeon]